MEELAALVAKHKWTRNCRRLNLGGEVKYYGKRPYLVKGHFSNVIKSGRMLELVQSMIPNTSELTINRSLECPPHRDKGNNTDSYILFLGDFDGGALVFENGVRYEDKGIWMGPFDGKNTTHWHEPITRGVKISIVAYSRNK